MGSFVSYLYYKNSVEDNGAVKNSQVVSAQPIKASEAVAEPIPIRHRPTTYEPELQIEQAPPAQ